MLTFPTGFLAGALDAAVGRAPAAPGLATSVSRWLRGRLGEEQEEEAAEEGPQGSPRRQRRGRVRRLRGRQQHGGSSSLLVVVSGCHSSDAATASAEAAVDSCKACLGVVTWL